MFAPPPPLGTTVTLDGAPVPTTELRRVEVDPGQHVIEASAAGKPTVRRTTHVAIGETRTVELGFEVHRTRAVPRAAYYLAGGGVALLASATAIGVLGKRHAEDASRAGAEAWNAFADYGLTSMYVAGLGCIGAGVALYLRAPLVPVVELDRVSLALTGRF